MRLYAGTSKNFITDAVRNQIAGKLKTAFLDYYRCKPSEGEVRSWMNSLRAVSDVFENAELLDHGVLLEYQLPLSSKRMDCVVCGRNDARQDKAVIMELKQWDECEDTFGENEVMTWVAGKKRDVLHPSVQVCQYKMYLQDTHTAFWEEPSSVRLNACSYLHNYPRDPDDIIFADKFKDALSRCPLFTADDFDDISDYLRSSLSQGEGMEVLRRIEQGKYRPSKKLMQHVGEVIKGNPQYILLDEQKIVYDNIYALAKEGLHDRHKHILLIRGGPGTGKSVIAINIMADLLLRQYNAHYATGSKAFTSTLRKVIGQRGSVQFKYFNGYRDAQPNEVDVLICDEAHRIRETSQSRYTAKAKRTDTPQIEELLRASKLTVFFIDDAQVVRPGEIGSAEYIRFAAEKYGAVVHEHELEIQFRCGGCESFVNWVENTLEMRKTPNILWNQQEDFDFHIFGSPLSLEMAIREKVDEGFTARMTAGFCWPWSRELSPSGRLETDVVIGDYRRPWNARHEATRLPPDIPKAQYWAYDPNGINQIGCIYTAQGFEFDYVGVIFGTDLIYDFDVQSWRGNRENSCDTVVKRSRDRFTQLTKNTYRVLLSRGMKGCYVHFLDKDTERFVKSRIES